MSQVTSPDRVTIKKIAVFRALYLGDLLLAMPALRSLRAGYPKAEITLIGLPWARSFAERCGYVDRFLEFPGFAGIPERVVDENRTQSFLKETQAYGYDLTIQMHGDGSVSNGFVAALGGKWSIGFSRITDERLSDNLLYTEQEHEMSKCRRLAELAGGQDNEAIVEFPLSTADQDEVALLCLTHRIRATDKIVGIHVGAKHPARRWAAEHWARVAEMLSATTGAKIVFTGGSSEQEMINAVVSETKAPAANMAGQTSLGGLAALIGKMSLFLSVDSGPSHLAYALGTKSVTIFGPTDPQRWGPLEKQEHRIVWRQVPCSPCTNHVCPTDHRCLTPISPREVVTEALPLMTVREQDQDEKSHLKGMQ